MAETSNHIPKPKRTRLPWTVVGMAGLAMAIAGCGGYASTAAKPDSSGPTKHGSQAYGSTPAPPATDAASTSIPQGNRGDMDADNNGGPNDGDGNR